MLPDHCYNIKRWSLHPKFWTNYYEMILIALTLNHACPRAKNFEHLPTRTVPAWKDTTHSLSREEAYVPGVETV